MMHEFVQGINNTVKGHLKNVHTAMPGTIVSFDPGSMMASVAPGAKFKKPDGTTMDFPQLSGVPVVFPQGAGQNATVAFPVKEGDGCIIIVSEQSLDYWMYGQETPTDLSFDLSNSMCIPGLFVTPNEAVQEACNSDAVVVSAGGSKVVVKEGSVEIKATDVKIEGNLSVSGSVTGSEVSAGGVSLGGHTH